MIPAIRRVSGPSVERPGRKLACWGGSWASRVPRVRRATILSTSLRGQLVRATGRSGAGNICRLPRLEGWDNCNAHFTGSRNATVADAPVECGREFLAGGEGQLAQGLAVKRTKPRRTPETHLPRCSAKLRKGKSDVAAHTPAKVPTRSFVAVGWPSAATTGNWRGAGVDCPGEAAACRLRRRRPGAPLLPASNRDIAETRSSPLQGGPFRRPKRWAFGHRMRHSALHCSADHDCKLPNTAVRRAPTNRLAQSTAT
ncbi:uncharacterized protein Tco025E_05838 [Trypanosoma conorhini]|uniref:Uncharacterized protein n=1 Tax=Trypanosoma conorhini TaxID=83891 RepID=A0A422P9U0_9TRYP|nr:uncharacterized protein Tco025E_05838 [Trypanosoma conorhini]RNF14468.1 hypothetical protein Tco025E_05838 [Trypanosoma conorhini]